MLFRTIRSRLVGWYSLALAAILVTFSVMVYLFLTQALYDSVDKKLKTIAEITGDSTTREMAQSEEWNKFLEEFFGYRPTAKYTQILDKSGNINYDEDKSLPTKLPLTPEVVERAQTGEVFYETLTGLDEYPIRMIVYPVMKNDRLVNLVQVGTSLEYVKETLERLLIIILIAVPTLLIASGVGAYFLAAAALKPVDEITTTARKIGAESLTQRIRIRNQEDELGRLADTFNGMIERLEKSFSQIKQFSADASHELRTPLTILRGETEWALRYGKTLGEYRKTLASNLEEIDHMTKIIESLLFLAKADMGDTSIEMKPIKLAPILKEVYEMGRVLAEMHGKKISCDIGELDGVVIAGNPLRLRQLFLNLVDNGIKYTKNKGSVNVAARHLKDVVEITVKDDGIGISSEDQKLIFDRFYRVDKIRSRKEGGAGLGLSISKIIAETHNGSIDVKSEPGKGSTFTVHLPVFSK